MYCAVSDVQKYIAVLKITTSSTPTTNQVEKIVEDMSDEIDFILNSLGYILPASTGANTTTGFLRKLCAVGTAGYVVLSKFPMDEYGEGIGSLAFKYLRLFDKYFERMQKGEYNFPDLQARPGTKAEGAFGKPACNYDVEDLPIFEHEEIMDFKDKYQLPDI